MTCVECGASYFFDDNYGDTYHCLNCYKEAGPSCDPGPPGEPGPPGLHNEDFEIKDYDEWLRETLRRLIPVHLNPALVVTGICTDQGAKLGLYKIVKME